MAKTPGKKAPPAPDSETALFAQRLMRLVSERVGPRATFAETEAAMLDLMPQVMAELAAARGLSGAKPPGGHEGP